MNYEVKCKIDGKETTIVVDENQLANINEQIIVQKVSAKVKEFTERNLPDAKIYLKDEYDVAMTDVAYSILDYLETAGGLTHQFVACLDTGMPLSNCGDADIEEVIVDTIRNMLYPYSEVHNDNFDENEKCYTIDTWYTIDDTEEGRVVAKVYLDGNVEFNYDTTKHEVDVLMAIEEVLVRIKNKT